MKLYSTKNESQRAIRWLRCGDFVAAQCQRLLPEQMDTELGQCIVHYEKLFVMDG